MDAFTKDQDFSSSLEGPSEAEVQAKEAAEREEALVEKIWEAPSEELKKERRDWYEPITERLVHASLMGEMQDVMGDSAQALQTPEQLLAFKEKQKRRGSISELRAKTRWKAAKKATNGKSSLLTITAAFDEVKFEKWFVTWQNKTVRKIK
eukprot:CAMPEP_0119504242 /NCGR_PEP_ID=MMETSP1344-20130328/25163_1 /TAXON_ID=236787 /ORGANISM="Florenciella parvula, Strain CCMP2471" /LENGTH=150 /DNA_ID=CAMNT_0007540595 /DNA_START=119 /DNA_END=568 /DNA_ORIENTATION=+